MKEQRILCDRCKAPNSEQFSIFKERGTDAAGSGENYYYTFDLCSKCSASLLKNIFSKMDRGSTNVLRDEVLAILKVMKIEMSVQ